MCQTEKFRKANELLSEITEMLSAKSTPIFETYMGVLNQVKEYIYQDKMFAVEDLGAGN